MDFFFIVQGGIVNYPNPTARTSALFCGSQLWNLFVSVTLGGFVLFFLSEIVGICFASLF